VQLKQITHPTQVQPPQAHKPFAADRKWSLAKEKADMDSFFDGLDHHAAIKEMAARKVHSHVAALKANHKQELPSRKTQLTQSHSGSGSGERALENMYYNKILSKDEAAREAAHKNDRVPHHDMSDAKARKDALSYFGHLEKAAQSEHKMIEAEEHDHTPKVYRHMSAAQAQADEKHFYSHETHQVKSEMAKLHLGADEKSVHMSADQLRKDVSGFYDKEMNAVMAAHAPAHPLAAGASAHETAKAVKAAAEKRLAQKHAAIRKKQVSKPAASPKAPPAKLEDTQISKPAAAPKAPPAKLQDTHKASNVQLKQWSMGAL